jgi:hypothetical protein
MALVQYIVAEGANIGSCLGPFSERKIVELSLEAGELRVFEIFWQNFCFESLNVEDLKTSSTNGP